jgi:hypothetical protein
MLTFVALCKSLAVAEMPQPRFTAIVNISLTLDDSVCIMPLSDSFKIEADYIDTVDKSKGVKLNLPEGGVCAMDPNKFYKVYYQVNCDLGVEGEFTNVVKLDDCTYEYHFTSKHGCYTKHTQYLLTFTSMTTYIIVVSFLMVIYCIGFMVLNYRTNPEDGIIKALPNRPFWTKLIEKSEDSITGLYNLVKRKQNKNNLQLVSNI